MSLIEPHILTLLEINFDTLFGKDIKGWANNPQGYTTGGWGITLTPDDMSKFGQLYLNHGVWNGKQVIPEVWTAASWTSNQNRYGYLWWQLEFGTGEILYAVFLKDRWWLQLHPNVCSRQRIGAF